MSRTVNMQSVLGDLEESRKTAEAELKRITNALAALKNGGTLPKKTVKKTVKATTGTRGRGRPVSDKSLAVFIHNALQGKNGMNVNEIAEAVKAAGYQTKSASFDKQINTTLSKDKGIKRVSRGIYAMK